MKFRLPFQIYRTGVISKSSSPGKILNKFSKDNEAKVRKKTSKINSSYRTLICNYIYRVTHLPLKITMSKLRNRTKLRSSTKSHKTKIRNEFVFLQEPKDNSTHKKTKNDEVTNESSECNINSTKCANFMCAKSTAKILMQQKDLLCNKSSNKSVTTNPEEIKSNENKNLKKNVVKSANMQIKMTKDNSSKLPPTPKKKEKFPEFSSKDKQKPSEYKIKFNKAEAVANSDKNRNYKIDEAPPAPVRMDNIMRAHCFPKKLPELPVQVLPKIEQVRLKEGPSLVAPKRKYNATEMTRNYKVVENVCYDPPRMDNIVECKAEPKNINADIKGYHENYTHNSKQYVANKSNNQTAEEKTYANTKVNNHKSLSKSNATETNTRKTSNDEKDAYFLKLDQVAPDLAPKKKKPAKSLQQLNTANITVSERIKKFEELIGNNSSQNRSKSEGLKTRATEEKPHGKQSEKKELNNSTPKLSPFAIAEIRRKYYPPDVMEKDRSKLSLPLNGQMTFAVPLIEKNDLRAETKLKQLYTRSNEQYKNLNDKLLINNPSDSVQKKHKKIRKALASSSVEEQKDVLALDIDNCQTVSLDDCSINSTIDTSTIHESLPKVLIPSPSKPATVPENKRNYSSTAIYECKDAYNICTDILNSSTNMLYSNLTATSNLCYNVTPVEKQFSSIIKKTGEINSAVSRAKKRNRIESSNTSQDLESLKQDRRFTTDALTKTLDERNNNARELDKSLVSNTDLTPQRNLSKRHCTIKVTSTLDNPNNTLSLVNGADILTGKLSYHYYHEQCTFLKNTNGYQMPSIDVPTCCINNPNNATIEINANDLITDERYNKMLNEKTTLINNYINWKMQLQKFGITLKLCSEPSKCCLNFTNGIDKQNKCRVRKYKIIRRKQKKSNNNFVRQEQIESINKAVSHIKTQIAQKCMLFDKISDALIKKADIINYHMKVDMQQKDEKVEYLPDNKKRKLSLVPMLDHPPKKKFIPVPETKKHTPAASFRKNTHVSEAKNGIQASESKNIVPEMKNSVEYMEVDIPPLKLNPIVSTDNVEDDTFNKRKIYFRKSSIKLKGPKGPSRDNSRLDLIHTNKNNFSHHLIKIKPPAIPATIKAKKLLAKLEARPDQISNMLTSKIEKKSNCQKSKTKSENIEKYSY